MEKNKHEYNRLLAKQNEYYFKLESGDKLSPEEVVSLERIKTMQEKLLEQLDFTADDVINQKDIVTGEPQDHTYGMWGVVEQQLTRENSDNQGLHGFMNFSFHDRITNKVENMQQIGLKYIGFFNNHSNDIIGLALNRVDVSDRFSQAHLTINTDAEYNIEMNYSYFPMKWLMLRPNI